LDGSPEQPDHDPAPEDRRRTNLLVGVVLSAAAVLVLAAWAVTRSSGQGIGILPPSNDTTEIGATIPTQTTTPTSVTTIAAPPTSIAVPPIDVEFHPGAAIIADHIICHREDDLIGDSVEAVRAAVAADNDVPSDPGGAPKPYAHDTAAQSEIVRASIQVLHDVKRFYANCERLSDGATGRSVVEAVSPSTPGTLPPSR